MNSAVRHKVDTFFERYPQRAFSKGQILIHAGEQPTHVYYLTSGLIRQYDITKSGKEIIVNIFKAPSVLPAWFAINDTPNSYFFDTATDVTARSIPIQDFSTFLHENHDVAFDLLRRVYLGLEGVQRRVAYLLSGSVEGRLLYELIYETQRFGITHPDGGYFLNVHESEMAMRTGLSRETISRHLRKLSKDGILNITHKGIIVRDLQRLEECLQDTVF